MTSTTAYVGLGANLGDAITAVSDAVEIMRSLPETRLTGVSRLFSSAPVDAGGNDFVNAVARLETQLDAHRLLLELQQIEHRFGRERPFPNAPRTLDLDLLLFGQHHVCSDTLEVPHPRMTARAFVLLPLIELDAAAHIPGKGDARQFLPSIKDQKIEPLSHPLFDQRRQQIIAV